MLPKQYAWLADEGAPRMLVEALKLYGTLEKVGSANNPVILAWAREIGVENVYNADSIPWCGLFIGVVAKRAGKPVVDKPLWALSWAKWGSPAPTPMLGDVLAFSRKAGGHVGLYVGEDATAFHVLGGNQSDKVCVTRVAKARLKAARRLYNVQPANVRRVLLSATGDLSKNEA